MFSSLTAVKLSVIIRLLTARRNENMKQYVVDAFTDKVFSGNPAAVCVLDKPISDELMQKITTENNLSETAFALKDGDGYKLRWFTPGGEIDLCGHATLATAYTIFRFYDKEAQSLSFSTLSGILTVKRNGKLLEMDFPAYKLAPTAVTDEIVDALGVRPAAAFMGRDLLCVMESESDVRTAAPDQEKLLKLDGLLVHLTAKGQDFDCVSRSFAPKCGVAEDPVCGSGHCHIVPYWAETLKKDSLTAYQASRRGGVLHCRVNGERIVLAGEAALFAESEIHVGE